MGACSEPLIESTGEQACQIQTVSRPHIVDSDISMRFWITDADHRTGEKLHVSLLTRSMSVVSRRRPSALVIDGGFGASGSVRLGMDPTCSKTHDYGKLVQIISVGREPHSEV